MVTLNVDDVGDDDDDRRLNTLAYKYNIVSKRIRERIKLYLPNYICLLFSVVPVGQ